MKIIENIMTLNPCYTAGRKIVVQGLMLHSVGCPQPDASVFVKNWNRTSYNSACVHAFISAITGYVHQTLPWNHRGWHAGASANNTHIGVEMCEPDCIKYTGGSSFTCTNVPKAKEMVKRTYDSAVELFAYLCKLYNLDPMKDGVIISHAEGARRGIATNHGDPEHLWKGLNTGFTMDSFRKAVKACMNGGAVSPAKTETPTQTATKPVSKYPNTPFSVQVLISDLNIRSAPISGAVKGQTGKGVFTITEVNGDWGKLKSGAGWIYLGSSLYTTIKTASTQTAPVKKSVEQVAKEVIAGKWGNGSERKRRLIQAGYDYNEVQKKVNKLL